MRHARALVVDLGFETPPCRFQKSPAPPDLQCLQVLLMRSSLECPKSSEKVREALKVPRKGL